MSSSCLSEEQLRAILESGIQGAALQAAVLHLDTCTQCCSRLDELCGGFHGGDPLVMLPAAIKAVPGQLMQPFQVGAPLSMTTQSDDCARAGETFPRRLGGYELIEELGRGGMGIVFKATDLKLDRLVALKVLRFGELASLSDLTRFQAEAEAAARLAHPNIVPIHEVGDAGPYRYFSMRLVEGRTLAAINQACEVRDRAWMRRCAGWLIPIAHAVHFAHQRGILHRDVKPGNILVDSGGRPYLTDFGLAKGMERTRSLTASQVSLGTPQYASPEQLCGQSREVTTAADVYSLGAVLYELITGSPPFDGHSPVATVRRVLDEQPRSPRLLSRAVDKDLATICMTCLQKDPGRRYPSAEAMAEDLERWMDRKPIRARPVAPMERALRFARRYPVGSALSILLLLALIVGGVVVVRSNRSMRRALASAAEAREREELARATKELALHNGLLTQASAIRKSHAVGRRFEAIPILQRAAEIMQSGRLATEAAAVLATFDLRELSRNPLPPLVATETPRHGYLTLDADLRWMVGSDPSEGLVLSALGQLGVVCQFEPPGAGVDPSITLSPDGRWFVCRRFPMLELWRSDDEKPFKQWPARRGEVTGGDGRFQPAAFSRDSMLLALPVCGGGIRLVALTRNEPERVVATDVNPALLAFDSTAKRLAVGEGSWIHVLEEKSGRVLGSYPTPGELRWIQWSPDGNEIAVSSRNHTPLEIRDALTGEPVLTLGLSAPASRIAFHPDGRMLAVATDDEQVGLWNRATARRILELEGNPRVLQFSADGRRFAVAGTMADVICYEVVSSKVYREFVSRPGKHSDSAYALDVTSDARIVVTADSASIRFWDVGKGEEIMSMPQPSPVWTDLRLAALEDHMLFVDPPDSGVHQSAMHRQTSEAGVFEAGAATAVVERPGPGHRGLVGRQSVVLAHREKEVQLWTNGDPADRRVIGHLGDHHATVPSLSPDGRLLSLIHFPGGLVEIWSTQDASLLRTLSDASYTGATFTPDGRYLLTAGRTELALWDVNSWRQVRVVADRMRRKEFGCLVFSPNGERILVQSSANSHRIYSYPGFAKALDLTSPDPLSRHVCRWSDDGDRLYTLARGNHLYEWNLPALRNELRRLGFIGAEPQPLVLEH